MSDQTLPVLMYHSMSDLGLSSLRSLGVPAERFGDQLDAVLADGYSVLPLTDALAVKRAAPGARVVGLTFDDAYQDFRESALEVLTARSVRATLYVPVGHVDGAASWLGARSRDLPPVMGWSELREVRDAGTEIGSHGWDHVPLDVRRGAEIHDQAVGSRERLEQELAQAVHSFCYPHGYATAGTATQIRRAGYSNACVIGHRAHRLRDDPYRVSRLMVQPNHSPEDLLQMLRRRPAPVANSVKQIVGPAWRTARAAAYYSGVGSWT